MRSRQLKFTSIGFLNAARVSSPGVRTAMHQGLRKLGYIERQNIIFEYRYAEGKFDRLPILAAELVGLIVGCYRHRRFDGDPCRQEATSTIPIVMTLDNDPVASGFVASLARPGGNITGLSTLRPELSGKRLEILKEYFFLTCPTSPFSGASDNPGNAEALKEVELAAGSIRTPAAVFLIYEVPKH